MAENDQTVGAEGAAESGRGVRIQKVYVKDASFESPNSPKIFTQTWEPKMGLEVDTIVRESTTGVYEVVLKITVTAKVDGETAFIAEVQQAGLFEMKGFSDEERQQIANSFCPTSLFPFAREVIGSMVLKGGFPGVLLQPINFDAVLAQGKTGG